MKKKLKIALAIGFLALLIVSFVIGWIVRDMYFGKGPTRTAPLRLTGFEYIKPLLICDTNPEKKYPELKPLETELTDFIDKQKAAGKIDTASIFFQDLKTDGKIDINKDEKFEPASLTKISVMIMIYKMAEINPAILSEEIKYSGGEDLNSSQEIKPKDYAKIGGVYTVNELIEKMIKYSDNISAHLLINLINDTTAQSLFSDLQIPFPEDSQKSNTMTTKDISYLFRILYNATYLPKESSEKSLQLLSEIDYKNGLSAGVPKNVVVSHKFGLFSVKDGSTNNIIQRQLHDCGIVYHINDPYLLCVMTKSSSDIPAIENFIKNVSKMAYQQVDNYSK
ncbi:MAG: class A beta-lactamase-related serine hydrolase [Candidatus Staskawiczbacteria bacterium]|nr:class A beta-lactamase-related serine hydrolase [Candidatus Staskawiczbacteria bacterium]